MTTSATFEVICILILCSALGTFCGLFSYFLDYCFYPGSIFGNYLPWLATKVLLKKDAAEWYRLSGKYSDDTEEFNNKVVKVCEERSYFWYKIFGGCSVCFNVWICNASYLAICVFSPLPWWGFLPYLVTSSFVIRKLVGAT